MPPFVPGDKKHTAKLCDDDGVQDLKQEEDGGGSDCRRLCAADGDAGAPLVHHQQDEELGQQ